MVWRPTASELGIWLSQRTRLAEDRLSGQCQEPLSVTGLLTALWLAYIFNFWKMSDSLMDVFWEAFHAFLSAACRTKSTRHLKMPSLARANTKLDTPASRRKLVRSEDNELRFK